jgi:molybdopterin synthase sulfur carrier subunit
MIVTIRYFAAAAHAAGVDEESREVPEGTTLTALSQSLKTANTQLAAVLERSCFLVDEIAVRDLGRPLAGGSVVDVLPPFAGG